MTRRDWLESALPLLPLAGSRPLAYGSTQAGNHFGDAAVLDSRSEKLLSQEGDCRRATLPGSTLKPFVLAALLERHLLKPDERLECPGGFRLGSRDLECIHVRNAGPLDAVEALAASCNYWFAEMSRRLGPDELLKALRRFGLAAQRAPSAEEVCLQALGLAHVTASPLTLARAYGALLGAGLEAGPPALVLQGMRAAVERGTAQRAASNVAWMAGKTGTAPGGLPGTSAGWFGGWALAFKPACPDAELATCLHTRPGIVLAVRVVGGTGGGAAAEHAKELAEQWAHEG